MGVCGKTENYGIIWGKFLCIGGSEQKELFWSQQYANIEYLDNLFRAFKINHICDKLEINAYDIKV